MKCDFRDSISAVDGSSFVSDIGGTISNNCMRSSFITLVFTIDPEDLRFSVTVYG